MPGARAPEDGASVSGRRRAPAVRPRCRQSRRRHRPSVAFISERSTMKSSIPCSSRNSERWKPSGSVWRIVCSITRGPAKPISASGSAMFRSPEHRVGRRDAARRRVRQDRDVRDPRLGQARERRGDLPHLHEREDALLHARAARGRDDDQGRRSASARSAARVIFSPTTEPIEPAMKKNSIAPMTTGMPSIVPEPTTIASGGPDAVLGVAQPVAVLLAVAELQRVRRAQVRVELDVLLVVEEHPQPLGRRQPEVDSRTSGRS